MAWDKQKIWKTVRSVGIISLWIFLLAGVIVSLAFVNKEEEKKVCSKINVNILPKNELLFVDRDDIIQLIHPSGIEKNILGKKILELNAPLVEQKLSNNDFIKQAQVFTDMNGALYVNLTQRRPILRIIKPDGNSFYLDENGTKMPVSQAFTAHVPIATGNIFEPYKSRDTMRTSVGIDLGKIATYVDKHTFWKAQIEQIFVTAESELVLIPKIGEHTIVFGTAENIEEKFDKLMLFYKEGLSRVGWNQYSSINLKYKNQIVCTKK